MARLSGQLTLIYLLFVVFTFFDAPFFADTVAPVVFVAARELHREQALARAQQRWNQRVYHLENSTIDPDLALLGPFDPFLPSRLSPIPTPTFRESHRFAGPSQTSVSSRTKSAPLNRVTSFPEEYDDPSPLYRRSIEKRAVCPFAIQTTVFLYVLSGAQLPFSTTTVAGPRSTGIPGDNQDGLVPVSNLPDGVPTPAANGGQPDGNEGHGANAVLAGIFSILGLIIIAFILTAWYYYRKRKARKLTAAGQIEEKKDAATISREMGSKGFTALGSSAPASQNRTFLHPGTIMDDALARWGRAKGKKDSIHSKASDDSELQEWNAVNIARSRRSVRWTEHLPPSPIRRGSDVTGDGSDRMYPTDRMSAARVEEASPALSSPQAPVLHETNILYTTSPDVLYATGPSRSESSTSSYAAPLSQSRSNFTGATSASRSISPRRATTTTATSVSPSFFKRTSVSPPRRDSREGELTPSARMTEFGLTPASHLGARTVGGAGQGIRTSSGPAEEVFSSGGYGAGDSSHAVPGPSGSTIPFPSEPLDILPIRRPPRRDETMNPERQVREKEMKKVSKRIVQLAMAAPGEPRSDESYSTDTHEVLEKHEGVPSKLLWTPTFGGSHPPVSIRPEHRKDSFTATTETHQTQYSTKSYPYAGLIALHAPTARPLSVSSKAKSPVSFTHLSLSAETDYGHPLGGQSKRTSRAASFSSSQYLYGYPTTNVENESVRGRSLRSSRRSSMSALSGTSPGRPRNTSSGPSGRSGARASVGPTSKAEAAQRAAALIQLTSGVRRRDR